MDFKSEFFLIKGKYAFPIFLKAILIVSLYVREDMLLHHLKILLHLTSAIYNVHVAWEERFYIEFGKGHNALLQVGTAASREICSSHILIEDYIPGEHDFAGRPVQTY